MAQHSQINVMYHVNSRKDKNLMIISIDAAKTFTKFNICTQLKKKNSHQGRYRGTVAQHNKGHLSQTHTQLLITSKRIKHPENKKKK